jgi:hypothetical protein
VEEAHDVAAREGVDPPVELAAFDRYADELTPALFGHWGAGAV